MYCMDGDVLVDEDSFMPFYRQYQRPGSRFRLAQDNSDIVKYLNVTGLQCCYGMV